MLKIALLSLVNMAQLLCPSIMSIAAWGIAFNNWIQSLDFSLWCSHGPTDLMMLYVRSCLFYTFNCYFFLIFL